MGSARRSPRSPRWSDRNQANPPRSRRPPTSQAKPERTSASRDGSNMSRRSRLGVLVALCALSSASTLGFAIAPHAKQVFPPRGQAQPPTPSAIPAPGPPPAPGLPPPMVRTIPFGSLLGGDFTKSFIMISNLRSPLDSNFVLGRGLTGRLALERH